MRILFLGNNWVGWQALAWLVEQQEDVVGVVLHPVERRAYGKEILETTQRDATPVFDGSQLRDPEVIEAIATLEPEIGVSVSFGYVLRKDLFERIPYGCINVHPAMLPFNRGAHPNIWSIVEGTPSGVSIHYIDEGIDTGDIIAQREVPIEVTDTGETLYRRLESASIALFQETWPLIRSRRAPRVMRPSEPGTSHRVADLDSIDDIELDRNYTARKLLDIVRARTFASYPGAYFRHEGRKIYLRLQLIPEEELDR